MRLQSVNESDYDQFRNWFLGQVCFPIFLVLGGMAVIYFNHQDMTETLAGGDLLLLGTLLSLGLTCEIVLTDTTTKPKTLLIFSFFLCVVFITAYVWLKTQLANYDGGKTGIVPSQVHACAFFSFLIGAIAIAWSVLGFMLFTKHVMDEKKP